MPEPISLGIQEAVPSFVRRYTQDPDLQSVPESLLRPLMQLDYNRVTRGQRPIAKNRLPGLLETLKTGESQVAHEPRKNMLERFQDDVSAFVKSIPKIPGMLVEEAKSLDEAPQAISEAINEGDYSKIFEAPGVRLLPGSYIAAEGRNALEHPLFATLDIAPVIKGGFGALAKTAKGAEVIGIVGRMADRRGFGPIARATARLSSQGERRIGRHMAAVGRSLNDLQAEFGVDDATRARLTQVAMIDVEKRPALIGKERDYVNRIDQVAEEVADRLQELGILGQHDNEWYPIATHNRFVKLKDDIAVAVADRNLKKVAKLTKRYETLYNATPPIRFRPLLARKYRSELEALARSRIPADNVEAWTRVQKAIQDGEYGQVVPHVSLKEMEDLAKQITPTWVSMKASGLDPLFLTEVAPESAALLAKPVFYPGTSYSSSFAKAGTWNVKPGVLDFNVGLGHAEYEFVREHVTRAAIDQVATTWGITRSAAIDEVRARNPKIAQTKEGLAKVLARDYDEWNPKQIFPWRKPRQPGIGEPEPMYMPKAFGQTIQALYKSQPNEFGKVWDNSMKVFRTSILPLSPRWHTYNIIGGAVLMLARSDPRVFMHLGEAYRMLKADRMPVELSRGFYQIPEKARLTQFETGANMGRFVDLQTKAGKLNEQTIGRLYGMAEFVDSMYRTMTYLEGSKKGIRTGKMTAAEAHEAGVKLSNKVLQDWDSMVPFERQVLRTIFPFYGWMRHILKYAFTYPWDHPWRASVVSNFARNEINDWNSGLPQDFQKYFFPFGGKDSMGNELGFNVGGANPFSDIGTNLTLAGFMSQLSPLFGGLLEASGVNTQTGKAEVYPNLTLNAETGRIEPITPSTATSVAEALLPPLPMARWALGLASGEEKELKASNPQAYTSMLFSSAGVPFLPRKVNKQLETARAELRRQDVMQDVLTNALRTGDWTEAMTYPALREVLKDVQARMARGELSGLELQPAEQGIVSPAQLLTNLGVQP